MSVSRGARFAVAALFVVSTSGDAHGQGIGTRSNVASVSLVAIKPDAPSVLEARDALGLAGVEAITVEGLGNGDGAGRLFVRDASGRFVPLAPGALVSVCAGGDACARGVLFRRLAVVGTPDVVRYHVRLKSGETARDSSFLQPLLLTARRASPMPVSAGVPAAPR